MSEMKVYESTNPETTYQIAKKMAENASLPVVFTVYQDVPLFTSAVCIRDNACKDCNRKPLWIDLNKDGQKYRALSKDCQLMMFAEKPFTAAKEAQEIKADFYRADFCYRDYRPEEVKSVFDRLSRFDEPSGGLKGNLNRINEMF